LGIGLAILGHILAVATGIALAASGSGIGVLFLLPEVLLFVAALVFGIMQLTQGDRGIGVGLLVGWGAGTIIFGGACVALIIVLARSLGG
jgi:hypothetical protein